MPDPSSRPTPERLQLEHPMFTAMGRVRFCSGSDGTPMMLVRLGEREAQMPLQSLRRQFDIGHDTPDGHMLDLIGSALDYVACLKLGDRLPAEVRTGEASWQPSPAHARLATARLTLALLAWLLPQAGWGAMARDEAALARLADDPAAQAELEAAAARAAGPLGLPDGATVRRLVRELSHEFAYIEALRSQLLHPVEALCVRLAGLREDRRRLAAPLDTLSQVHKLTELACRGLRERFDVVDASERDARALLGDVPGQRRALRAQRDWMYREQRAWDPVLAQWGSPGESSATEVAAVLAATYRFLAPRFMPTHSWQAPQPGSRQAGSPAGVAW